MKKIEKKSWPRYFEEIRNGVRMADVRIDDAGYADGDTLVLREFDPERGQYTGASLTCEITRVLRDVDGIMPQWCVLTLRMGIFGFKFEVEWAGRYADAEREAERQKEIKDAQNLNTPEVAALFGAIPE